MCYTYIRKQGNGTGHAEDDMQNGDTLTEAQREYLECIGVDVDPQSAPPVDAEWRKRHERTDRDLRWERILHAAE